jgi:hypothetical protein
MFTRVLGPFMRWLSTVLFVSAVILPAATPASEPGPARAQAAIARLPLDFEANQGQWNPAVRYSAHGQQYNVLLTGMGPSLEFRGGKRVDLRLEGSNPAPEMAPSGRMAVATSYFLGSRENWRTGVPNYSRVRYRDVYPGIDATYYGNDRRLEYDFVVGPGADPAAIRMRFQGADRTSITPEGDLLMECAAGSLVEKRPVAYQEGGSRRRGIDARYVRLADGAVGLRVGKYDRTKPLTIDPYLIYSSFWGGGAADEIVAVKMAANGLLYVVGKTETSDLVASGTAYQGTSAAIGANDLFLMVLDTTNNLALQYLSYLGGTGDDNPTAMDLDAAGNMYVTGNTTSTDFPLISSTALQSTSPSSTGSVFVVQFNPSLSSVLQLVYSTYLGGSLTNTANDIRADSAGNIYVIGSTNSTDFPITDGAYSGILSGLQNAFLVEINTGLTTAVYSTYLGGEGTDTGNSLALASNGLVYCAITTNSKEFPLTISPYLGKLPGQENMVIAVVNTSQFGPNSLLYDTYFGGSGVDEARKINFDASGRVLLTGYTLSTNYPTTTNAVQKNAAGNGDVFVTVVDPAHPQSFLVYSTYLGGSQGEVAYDIAGDATGNIYVAGYTLSPDFPATANAPQPAWGQGIDVFVAKLIPGVAGTAGLPFATYLGGKGINVAYSFAFDRAGTMYVGGYGNLGFPAMGSNANQYGGGSSDGVVFALSGMAGQQAATSRTEAPKTPRFEKKRSAIDN